MAQVSGLTNNQQLRSSKKPEPDDIDVDEMPIPQKRTFYERVYEMAEKFAENSLGQFVIERADRMLKVVEDTAKWSLPQENNLERPMSWVPFLMLIVTLRLLRFWLTVGAMMIGNGPVTPANTVYFIQTRRRKLRALRVHGAKVLRRRAAESRMEASNGSAADKSIVDKLRNLLSIAICRPGQQREQAKSVFIKQDSGFVVGSSNDRQSSKRPRDDSLNDHNLTIDQMLSKYANEDSDDDSDFVPRPEEETNDDSTSASDSDEASDASSDEDSNAEASAKEKTPRKQTSDGVEIVENGTGKRSAMPKPMQEIKKEMHSDADSMNDESTPAKDKNNKKQMGNGVEKQQNQQSQPTAKKTTAAASTTNNNNKTALTNGMPEKQQTAAAKTTANGTDSAGMPKQSLALNTTANAATTIETKLYHPKLPKQQNQNLSQNNSTTTNKENLNTLNFEIVHNHSNRQNIQKTLAKLEISPLNKLTINGFSNGFRDGNGDGDGYDSDEDDENDIFYSPIGSPTDFNACFAKLINDDTTNATTTSTPTSNFETELYDNFPISEQSNLLTEDQQQQPQQPIYAKHQPFYHNQRYRGKNRRY